ncbi:SpaA isopeptide-forming pilin-related protein [Bifidobacterium aerophilum]|uniref:LPXTG cell wall anchor domain-containing protein n=1 Tax=Bifidobacterium aerophilum TaxID=1798155 RepID=A0A6N9Z4N2_9BIFI|nr:SpaA isopeptide-forming pilin-related protein [Bifidobacterium aerophilum]NEG89548.1 LPXTG cell wall anchor domain-containing protein [Bifidobacterium aerophilum]
MKIRKIVAGLAASATLLGGLAVGAVSAQAAETDPAITINNTQTGHTYTAYLFATLDNPQVTDGALTSIDVNTAKGWRSGLIVGGYDDTVREAAQTANGGALSDQYANNPAAAVATFDQTKLRTFADELSKSLAGHYDGQPSVEGNGSTVQLTVAQGWYLITDTTGSQSTVTAGTSAIVATPVTADGTTFTTIPVTTTDGTQTGIDASGTVNSKQQVTLNKPVTTSSRDAAPTVSYGSSPTYTTTEQLDGLTGDVYLKIVTSAGVKVPNGEIGYRVFNDANGNGKYDSGETTLARSSDYVLASQTGDYKSGITTVIKLIGLDGSIANLGVTYSANVGADIDSNVFPSTFTNTPSVSLDQATWVEGEANTLRTAAITFQKVGVDADADGLNGAAFAIRKAGDDGCVTGNGVKQCYLKFGKVDSWNPAGWSFATNATDYTVTSATVDGKNGVVTFNGLGAGTYTIEEVTPADGYSNQFKPKFDVTIAADGTVTFASTADSLGLVAANDDNTAVTVKNVKAISQLPLTGSIGGAVLSVIGVLALAGIVVLRVRSRKDAYVR